MYWTTFFIAIPLPPPPPNKKKAMKMLKRYSLPSSLIGAGCWYLVANFFGLQIFPVHWWLLSHVLWDCNLGTYLCILRYNVSCCCFITCRHSFSYVLLIYSLSWCDSLIAIFDHMNFYLFSSGPNAEGSFMVHVIIPSINCRICFGVARYFVLYLIYIF